jgi:hypothetical protein
MRYTFAGVDVQGQKTPRDLGMEVGKHIYSVVAYPPAHQFKRAKK